MSKNILIFLVEDDTFYREMLHFHLYENGYKNIQEYASAEECMDNLYKMPDVVFMDYNMKGTNGMEALQQIKSFHSDIEVILLSGQESIEIAVNSLRYGAFDYIIKNDVAMEKVSLQILNIDKLKKLIRKRDLVNDLKTAGLVITSTLLFFSGIYTLLK
ncbi:MAG: response regulator [Cytophagaceae bacterium]|jgi:DNA-binding NtrC family response regulator|nr:response regulator [Cytophagaceae bacterium]